MKRRVLIGAGVVQAGLVLATVFSHQYLFVPAALGLVLIAASIPEETR